jgi:hypothetical protein
MGYDLHITRRKHWSDDGCDITAREWLDYVAGDAELKLSPADGLYWTVWSGPSELPQPWLDWDAGQIFTKNPDEPLIRKMFAVADALQARVQGDDGEFYDQNGNALPGAKPSRIRAMIQALRSALTPRRRAAPPDFSVGDRIVDVWGRTALIAAIDLYANQGLGAVTLRYDDGRELTFTVGSQFRRTDPNAS